jgi:hypothetical protein
MNDLMEQNLDEAKVLYDRDLLKLIFGTYLKTERMTIEEVSEKYDSKIGTDEDGIKFSVLFLEDKVAIHLSEDTETKELKLGSFVIVLEKGEVFNDEQGFSGTYYRLPDDEELEAFLLN